MIIWRGLGFLAVLIPMIFIGLIGSIDQSKTLGYGFEMALIMSAIAIWFIGKKLNNKPGKLLIDPKTNQQIEIKDKHSLFWIPMEWVSIVIAAFAIVGISKHF